MRPKTLDLGPSSAHRWSICTASPQFLLDNADRLPKREERYADEGTLCHSVASALLLNQPVPSVKVAEEMVANAALYAEFARSHHKPGAIVLVEKRVPLFYLPSRNGIVDHGVYHDDGIYVDDLKYGIGVSVEAEGNPQLALYGESLIRMWEQVWDVPGNLPVHLSIFQPRDRANPEPVRTWTLTRAELAQFAGELQVKAEVVLAGKGQFVPSDKGCRFCDAKGLCSAYASQGLVALPPEARVIELPPPGRLSREQRVEVLKAKKVLAEWLEAVEDQEVAELMAGAEPAGFKLVEGKSNREWRDEEAAQQLLSNHLTMDEMKPRSPLISPHAAEKALKGVDLSTRFRNKMESLITKPEGKPTLVPQDDRRPALEFNSGLSALTNNEKEETHGKSE